MPFLLFFAGVIWAWELKLNFQRYFVVCVMKMKMKTLQVIALFYDPSLTDYSLFQTRRLNIFSILFFSGIFHSLVLVLQCHQSPFSVFLAGDL